MPDMQSISDCIPSIPDTLVSKPNPNSSDVQLSPMLLAASDSDSITNPCGTHNVISIGLLASLDLMLCAGVDQKLHVYHNSVEVVVFKFHSPILDICVYDRDNGSDRDRDLA